MITGNGMSTAKSNNGRSKVRWNHWVLAALFGAVMVLSYSGQSVRAEDDDEDELIDTKIAKGLLRALGLRKDGDGIEYRERAPLVLPPGHDLPPPEASTKPSAKVANWPDDPDVKRAKKQKAERKASNPEPDDAGRPLTPSQYNLPGRGSPSSRPNGPTKTAEDYERAMTPYELGSKNIFSQWWGSSKEEYATFTSEPPRDRLIDPPSGYRTPSPSQPYGVGVRTWSGETLEKHIEAK